MSLTKFKPCFDRWWWLDWHLIPSNEYSDIVFKAQGLQANETDVKVSKFVCDIVWKVS